MYHKLYLAAKGNQFKNKNVLVESIHKAKAEVIREKELEVQQAARRAKNTIRKNKRVARKNAQMGIDEPSPAAPAKPTVETPAAETEKPTKKPKGGKKWTDGLSNSTVRDSETSMPLSGNWIVLRINGLVCLLNCFSLYGSNSNLSCVNAS